MGSGSNRRPDKYTQPRGNEQRSDSEREVFVLGAHQGPRGPEDVGQEAEENQQEYGDSDNAHFDRGPAEVAVAADEEAARLGYKNPERYANPAAPDSQSERRRGQGSPRGGQRR